MITVESYRWYLFVWSFSNIHHFRNLCLLQYGYLVRIASSNNQVSLCLLSIGTGATSVRFCMLHDLGDYLTSASLKW